METVDYAAKFRRISELNEEAEQACVHQLKLANPSITEVELKVEVQKWWLDKEEYWPEEFFRPISKERFKRMFGRNATVEEIERMKLRNE